MTLPDPLLPLPDEPLHLPEGLDAEERLKAAFVAVSDHINLHAMAWPAKAADGKLVAPPPSMCSTSWSTYTIWWTKNVSFPIRNSATSTSFQSFLRAICVAGMPGTTPSSR